MVRQEVLVLDSPEELKTFLSRVIVPGRTAVIGVGNELRCDDGFGSYIAKSLANILVEYSRRKCLVVVDAGTGLEAYIDLLEAGDVILILDAIEAPVAESKIVVIDRNEIPEYSALLSTHNIGFDVLMRFIRGDLYVVGTRPFCLDLKLGVSRSVSHVIQVIIKTLVEVLRDYECIKLP